MTQRTEQSQLERCELALDLMSDLVAEATQSQGYGRCG
jgi:hypothetical protein